MLQANPGLTPPLIKAILQYTAEPLAGYNLLEQGAGLVNVAGSIAVANALGARHRRPRRRGHPARRRQPPGRRASRSLHSPR